MNNFDEIQKAYYKLGKAEGRMCRYKEALEKVKELVSGEYETLDPQAKIEIQRIVENALNV